MYKENYYSEIFITQLLILKNFENSKLKLQKI